MTIHSPTGIRAPYFRMLHRYLSLSFVLFQALANGQKLYLRAGADAEINSIEESKNLSASFPHGHRDLQVFDYNNWCSLDKYYSHDHYAMLQMPKLQSCPSQAIEVGDTIIVALGQQIGPCSFIFKLPSTPSPASYQLDVAPGIGGGGGISAAVESTSCGFLPASPIPFNSIPTASPLLLHQLPQRGEIRLARTEQR